MENEKRIISKDFFCSECAENDIKSPMEYIWDRYKSADQQNPLILICPICNGRVLYKPFKDNSCMTLGYYETKGKIDMDKIFKKEAK